jgi:hypothetical protein
LSINNIDLIYQRLTGFLSQVIVYNLNIIKRIRRDAAAGKEIKRLFRLNEIKVRYAENRNSETENVIIINII